MAALKFMAAPVSDARRGTGTKLRAAAHGRAQSLAPQYVVP
jgi:hypothetical protein